MMSNQMSLQISKLGETVGQVLRGGRVNGRRRYAEFLVGLDRRREAATAAEYAEFLRIEIS
jgi:hypothetical protein